MRILQLIYESLNNPFGFGGAGVRACEIYKRLKERHRITLLCMKHKEAEDGLIEGLYHKFVGARSDNLTKSVLAYTMKSWYYLKRYGNEYDIIVENFLPTTPFFSKYLTKTPVILQVQGIMEKHTLKKFNPLYSIPIYSVESFYPKLYEQYIFVSHVTKEKFFNYCEPTKASPVITNGINSEYLETKSTEGDYILFFSRIDTYTKGLDILVKSFEEVCVHFNNVRLVMAGYEFNKFEELIVNLPGDVKKRIEYAGFLSGSEKLNILSNALFFVLPSRHESSPISIIEAAACGKPILVSNIPELQFVERESIGIVSEHKNLALNMTRLIEDKDLRKTLGENAKNFAKKFLWDSIALQFEYFLEQTVKESQKG